MKVNAYWSVLVVLALFVIACTPQEEKQVPEMNKTEEKKNETAKKYTIAEEDLQEAIAEKQKKNCAGQIKDLEEMLDDTKYFLMKLNTNKTKSTFYLQYLKEEIGKEKEYEEELQHFDEINDELRETISSIDGQERAIKLLKDKCDLNEDEKKWDQ